jgi:hypothetical protein
MPADQAEPPKYFVDESSVAIGRALAAARRDVVHPGHPRLPEVPLGTVDPVWMPIVARRNLVVIARDRHIRTKPVERELFLKHRLRVFWISGPKDLSNWANLCRLVKMWPRIEKVIATAGPGPWFYSVNDANLKEIRV